MAASAARAGSGGRAPTMDRDRDVPARSVGGARTARRASADGPGRRAAGGAARRRRPGRRRRRVPVPDPRPRVVDARAEDLVARVAVGRQARGAAEARRRARGTGPGPGAGPPVPAPGPAARRGAASPRRARRPQAAWRFRMKACCTVRAARARQRPNQRQRRSATSLRVARRVVARPRRGRCCSSEASAPAGGRNPRPRPGLLMMSSSSFRAP